MFLHRRQFVRAAVLSTAWIALPKRAIAHVSPKILILGDSMIAGGFGLYLENALRKLHGYRVRRKGKSSSGLARPDFFDWMKEARAQVDVFSPDATVVMFGGNDVQGLWMGKDAWIRWPDEGWNHEYSRRVHAFCDIVAPRVSESSQVPRVFWVGMPVMRPKKFHVRVQRINTIVRDVLSARPGATFIDTWSVLADARGQYTDRLDIDGEGGKTPVRVRAKDGIHLTVAGAHHLESHVRLVVQHELGDPKAGL